MSRVPEQLDQHLRRRQSDSVTAETFVFLCSKLVLHHTGMREL